MSQRRAFRIEKMLGSDAASEVPGQILMSEATDVQHVDTKTILDAIESIRSSMSANADIEILKQDMAKAKALDGELNGMQEAILSTKREIAALHSGGFHDDDLGRVTSELDAVISGTEIATERILSSMEEIDELANNLSAGLQDVQKAMASDIQEKVIEVFEACNFQDLTGQRITKVVRTLEFIETRIDRMIELWGGIESFKEIEPADVANLTDEQKLLNGPALDSDEDIANQDDIDALFA